MMWHHGRGYFRHDVLHPFGHPFMHGAYDGWWLLAMAVVALLVLAVLITLTLALLRGTTATTRPTDPQHQALDVLRSRYANGEIDEEEFQHRVEVLGKHGS